jgi:heat shock protein HslJ
MPNRARRLGRCARACTLAGLAIAIVGCSPEPASPTSAGLVGTSWTVATINGGTVVPNAPPTITFSADRKVGGTTGCNQYSGLFSTNGNKMTVGAMSSTEMACDGARSEQEAAFLNGLGGAATWRINQAGDLEIDGAAAIVARPGLAASQPPPTPGAVLGGTAWNLVEMGGTADFARIVPTIAFGADGRVSGFAGCNRFSGTYDTDGPTLTVSRLATTKIACPRPASAVEADYLAALDGVTTWAIDSEGRLTLDGAVLLLFASG